MDSHTNAVAELYALHHKNIVRFFAEHLVDREAAWDLCHEVFVRLLITIASGTQLHAPQRWLLRVAKNLLIDTYRYQQAVEVPLPLESQELTMLASDATTFKILLEHTEMLQILASSQNRKQSEELGLIDRALRKLAEAPGDYGMCEECDEPIAPRRLELMPYATLCTECQSARDPQRGKTRKSLTDFGS